MSLFFKECKNISKSYIYYVFIGAVLLFYISQMGVIKPENLQTLFSPPKQIDMETNYAPYGEKKSEPSKAIIPKAITHLYREYKDNIFITYPLGFYKKVRLNESEIKKIEQVLEEVTGKTMEEISFQWDNTDISELPISESITIERFYELMESTDKLLGGGSSYREENIAWLTRVPITYEEAMEEYKYTIEKDKLSNGCARLFCDYIGIIIGIFPIFVAVFMTSKDNKTKMDSLIYSRKTSSLKIVLSRYFALNFMMLIPIIALGIKETIIFIIFANSQNLSIDLLAFIKYIIWWILPTLMVVTAIGMFLTILTDKPIAIAVGLFMWFLNLMNIELIGDYPLLGLFIRHNNHGKGILIAENYNSIMLNRLLITGIAFILVLATIFVFERKRRGKLDIGTKMGEFFSFNKNKSKTSYSK